MRAGVISNELQNSGARPEFSLDKIIHFELIILLSLVHTSKAPATCVKGPRNKLLHVLRLQKCQPYEELLL